MMVRKKTADKNLKQQKNQKKNKQEEEEEEDQIHGGNEVIIRQRWRA
jgi:hypothetical protein